MIGIKQSVLDLVSKKYQIIDVIDLCNIDEDPKVMADYFATHAFCQWQSTQRLVVLHHETDYYPNGNCLGNTIYNFLRLCANFQIPLEFIIFFTNHYGLKKIIHKFSKEICNEVGPCVIETSQWYDMPDRSVDFEISKTPGTRLYACLNGVQRRHRIFTLCALAESGLIELGMLSYHFGSQDVARYS